MEIHFSFMIESFPNWMFSSIAGQQTTKPVTYNDTYFAQESPVWAGISETSSSLLHLALAGAAQRLGLNYLEAPPLTDQIDGGSCP